MPQPIPSFNATTGQNDPDQDPNAPQPDDYANIGANPNFVNQPTAEQLTAARNAGQISQVQFNQGIQNAAPSYPWDTTDPNPHIQLNQGTNAQGQAVNQGTIAQPQSTPTTPGATPTPPSAIDPSTPPSQPQPVNPANLSGLLNTTPGYGNAGKNFLSGMRTLNSNRDQIDNQTINALQSLADGFTSASSIDAQRREDELQKNQKEQADKLARNKQIVAEHKSRSDAIDRQLTEWQQQGVDPNHMWKNLSTGGKIGTAIGLLLGGIGAAAPGKNQGVNNAVGIMKDAIDRDVDAQKENFKNRMDILGKRMNLNDSGFNRDIAALRAESDASQLGYKNVLGMLDTKTAMYKDNYNVQTALQTARQQLAQHGVDRSEKYLNDEFAIAKENAASANAGNAGKLTRAQADQYRADQYVKFRASGMSDPQAKEAANNATNVRLGAPFNQSSNGSSGDTSGESANTASAAKDLGRLGDNVPIASAFPFLHDWSPDTATRETAIDGILRSYAGASGGRVKADDPSVKELGKRLMSVAPGVAAATRATMAKNVQTWGQEQTTHGAKSKATEMGAEETN